MSQIQEPSGAIEGRIRRLALVAERTHNAVLWGDVGGCIEWVNQGFTNLTGYTLEEMVGRRVDSLLSGERADRAILEEIRDRFLEGQGSRGELRILTQDGEERWVELELEPVQDEYGTLAEFLAIATDVTERKRAERELAASEDRYRRLVELCPDPIAVHQDGRLVFINPACAALFGAASPHEVVGRSILDFVHPEGHAQARERVRKVLEVGESVVFLEYRFLRLDGSELIAEVAAAPTTFAERPAVQVVMRDATARIRSEQVAREKDRRSQELRRHEGLRQLAEGAARHLSRRLFRIANHAERMLAGSLADREDTESLHAIRRNALDASELTRQLRTYAGREPHSARPLDLSRLVVGISQRLESRVPRGVTLNFDLAGNLPVVEGDAAALGEVVSQLVHNAVAAVARQGGLVSVRTRAQEGRRRPGLEPGETLPAGPHVALVVRDTGPGMDPETRERIFDPFFTRHARARGLGLAATLGIVARHHGAIEVESEPGEGTTLTVLLPTLQKH